MLEDNQLMVIDNKKRNRHISIIIGVTMILSIIMSIIPSVGNIYATNIIENGKTNTTVTTTNETTTSKGNKDNNTLQDTNEKNTSNANTKNTKTKTNKNDTTSKNSKSNNANLKELGMKPNDFKGFNPSKASYSVTVENNVENIEIYAVAQHAKATISGTGKKNLKEGKNTFNIIVTAEDNTKKTYTLIVNRKSENSEETDEQNNNDVSLSELEVKNIKLSPEFSPDIYEYNIILTDELDKLDITAVSEKKDATIEILGNENLVMGENLITILVKDNDKEVSTYQLIVNKKQALPNNQEEISETLEQNTTWSNKKKIIVIALIAITCIAGITALIIRYKHTDGQKEEKNNSNKKEKTKGKRKPKRMN